MYKIKITFTNGETTVFRHVNTIFCSNDSIIIIDDGELKELTHIMNFKNQHQTQLSSENVQDMLVLPE